jgi:hypothetical protein
MNAVAIMYMNSHLMELQAAAQHRQMASQVSRRSLRQRLGTAAASLRSILGAASGSTLPKLKDYPYGG